MIKKPIAALFDWDNTLRDGFTLVDWSRHLSSYGVIDPSTIPKIEGTFESYFKGELDYSLAIKRSARIYATGLRGASVEATHQLAESFARQDQELYDYATVLFGRLREIGVKAIVVSGAPDIVLAPYAANLGFDLELGLTLRTDESRTT